MKLRGILVASAALGMLAAPSAALAEEGHGNEVKCSGVNGCGGKGECAATDGSHGCAGQNACKGKGWVHTSADDCTSKGGTVVKE